jgi:hypothetical protein
LKYGKGGKIELNLLANSKYSSINLWDRKHSLMRNYEIIATLGPASDAEAVWISMLTAGAPLVSQYTHND